MKVEGPLATPNSPLEERRAIQDVLESFGLTLRAFDRKGGVILTDRGPHQLRRFPGTWEDLEFVAAALDHLERQGFRALRHLCRTSGGEPGIRCGTGLYYLAQGEPGRSLTSARESELARVAGLLAAFHRAGEGLPSHAAERRRYEAWPAVLQDRHAELQLMRREAVHVHGEFARLFAEYADDFLEQADRAVTGLLASPLEEVRQECAERRQLAHRHFTPSNLRRLRQDLLIDGWTHLALDLPVIDVARFLQRAADHDPDRAYAFLSAYHEDRPLSEPEWEVFLAWLRFPHAFWRLGHLHFTRRETHRSRLAKVIHREVEREVFIETLALQWAARELAPVVPVPAVEARAASTEWPEVEPERTTGEVELPKDTERLSQTGESQNQEREATLVTQEDELVGLGILVEEVPGSDEMDLKSVEVEAVPEEVVAEPAEPFVVAVEPFDDAVEPVLELEPVIEVEPVVEVEPVIEVEPVLEVEPAVEAEPVIEAEPVLALEPVVEVEPALAVEPAVEASPSATPDRIIVWRPFPPPLTGSGR